MTEQPPPVHAYVQRLEAGTLPYQTCTACAAVFFYPRLLCPQCGGAEVDWRDSAGRGTVYSRTVVHNRDEEPFNVVLIDMDEGFRVMSKVEDVANDDVQIGMKVVLKTIHPAADDSFPKPVFRPAEDR